MPAEQKIIKHGLQERTLALRDQYTHREIADILTKELAGKDSISQPAVSRFLKKVSKRRSEILGPIRDKFVETELESDLKILKQNLKDAQGLRETALSHISGKVSPINKDQAYNIADFLKFDNVVQNYLKITFHFCGVGDDEGSIGEATHPVDLTKYKTEEKAEQNG